MKQRALIDINMILDTRLGTLARLNPVSANLVARSDWYFLRDTDDFEKATDGVIKNDDFKAMYLKYEAETLSESLFTIYVHCLRKDIKEIYPKLIVKEIEGRIRFDINIYPYDLYEEEREILKRSLSRYLTEPAEVRVVSIPWSTLNPGLLNNSYDMMALYNYEDWLKHHYEELINRPIQGFTIFSPRIAPSGTVPEPDKDVKDPFMAVPLALTRHIQLHPIPTEWVCWNKLVYDKTTGLECSPQQPGFVHLVPTPPEKLLLQVGRL